ncbi:MAG: sugar phosphate isomerase/epimerase family protein [Methanocorpusculum sp.]|nr:sugar phosphate isomerase/epimerase family protein [Methanocorpusculum sp.]
MSAVTVSISTHALAQRPPEEALEELASRTSAVELMNDGLHYTTDAALLSSFSFRYSIHAPARSVNISSVLEPIRRASVELVEESLELAAECNASHVVFHPGYYTFKEEYEKSVSALKQSLKEINRFAEETGVICCVENMGNWGYFFLKSPDDLELTDGTGFCLDIGHANECGNLYEFLKHPFSAVHVHDNDGTSDAHLGLGKGNIDVQAVVNAIKQNHITSPVAECAALEAAVETKVLLEKLLG